jgi:hypothetical protein
LSEPQPLVIKSGTSAILHPEDKSGIVYLDINQEIEIYCTGELSVPVGVGNSAIAKCIEGNLFKVKSSPYSFTNFTCKTIPYHTARKTGRKCFNDAAQVEIGFDLGNRFVKVFEVCHDEKSEETYFAKHRLTPASEG